MAGNAAKFFGRLFSSYVGMFIFICDTIFLFMMELPLDLSIRHAKPTTSASAISTNFEHSMLYFPVVSTSSTIKTLAFFKIVKSLLSLNTPSARSEKIVSFLSNLPIS